MRYMNDPCAETKGKDNDYRDCCMDKDRNWDKGRDCDKDKNRDKDKDFCSFPKHPKPSGILLECGVNPQDAIFDIDDEEVERGQEFVLDRLVIDTTCLIKPQVKIEFSSIVFFEAEAENGGERELEVDLLFKLVRICDKDEEVLQTWRYIKEFEIENCNDFEVTFSQPFTVTFCDRACPGCCTYKMIVKGKDFEGEFEALRVVSPSLSALAQGICAD